MSLPQLALWERGYNVSVTRTLGKSLLTVGADRRATKARQTTLEQAKTVLSTSRTLSQATKVRLRYKRVDFLGTANRKLFPGIAGR